MGHTVAIPPVTDAVIQDISRRIVENFHPERIVLFGSHAYGSPHPYSDIDLLVIMETRTRPVERALPILQTCRPRFVAMDVLVRTPQELAGRLAAGDSFFSEITRHGRVLYERPQQ
jgi:predicted nucleotidyltransferase